MSNYNLHWFGSVIGKSALHKEEEEEEEEEEECAIKLIKSESNRLIVAGIIGFRNLNITIVVGCRALTIAPGLLFVQSYNPTFLPKCTILHSFPNVQSYIPSIFLPKCTILHSFPNVQFYIPS